MNKLNMIKLGILLVCVLFIGSNSHGSELQRSTLQVANLSCPSCIGRIELELKKIPGMVGMSTDLQRGIVMVDHGSRLAPANISAVITKTGYPSQILSTQSISKEEASFFSKGAAACGAGGCGGAQNCGAAGASWKELYKRFIKKARK